MPTSVPLHIFSSWNLPLELVDELNQAYFLHLLATDPSQVVPPGKSILSMMSRPHTASPPEEEKDPVAVLQRKVESMVHKAFWDEVRICNNVPNV
jgi:hypothetical protein